MEDNKNVYERAKALVVDKHAKTTQGGSVYERAKALATGEGVAESLGDLSARIGANAEAYNRTLANKGFEKTKADTKKMLNESTLGTKPYAASEDVQQEELQGFMDDKAEEARSRGIKDYLDSTIGTWSADRVSSIVGGLTDADAERIKRGAERVSQFKKEGETPEVTELSISRPKVDVQLPKNITEANILMDQEHTKGVSNISFSDLADKSKVEASKIVKDYLAENPHMEANKDMLEGYVANNIYNDTFKWKLENDEQFFADAFEATHGIKYKDFLKERVDKIKDIVKDLRDEAGAVAKEESRDRAIADLMADNRGELRIPALEGAMGKNLAEKPYDDFLEQINAWEKNNFASSFASDLDWSNFFSLGLADMINEAELNNVLEKANKGEKLYGEEARLLELAKLVQEVESYKDKIYESQNLRSKVGGAVGTTVEMMPEFALAMTGTGAIGSFAKIGGKAALKAALKAGGKELFKYGAKTVGKLGYNYGLAKARGLVAAPIMPSTYNTYLESLNSAYSFDDEGNLTYTPVDKKQQYFGAVFSTANEVSSEYLGIGIGKVVGLGARGVGRMVANTKLAEVAVDAGNKVRKYLPKLTPQAKVAMRTLGVQADPVSETLSEALGDIMTSYEQSMIGMDVDMSQYGTLDYWMTLAGTTLVYGGSMAALGATKSYFDVKNAVKQRDKILGEISNRNLYNTLLTASTTDDVVMASSALADFDWNGNKIKPEDNDYKLAQAFRVADLNVKIMEGMVNENTRLESFRGTIEGVRDIVYQGKAGEYSDMIFEAEVDGKKVYVINGFEKNSNTGQYIVYDPATSEKTSIDASKVKLTREISVDDYIDEAYANAFSLEMEKERIADIKEKALQMDNPTEKDVQRVASTMSIALPKVGNTVMLANGNMGEVTEVLSPAEFVVRDVAGATYKVHFTDILSTDKLTATAQGTMARGEASTAISPANEAVVSTEATEAAEATPKVNDENGIAMGAEVTIDGRVGKVRARTQDGRYAVAFEAESGNYEDAEIEFFTGEELASLMGITPASTAEVPAEAAQTTETTTEVKATEDGRVDVEQLSAEEAAKVLIQRAGNIEEAIAQVKQVIEAVTEERKKAAKAEKKTSLNDIGTKSAELIALDARIEFYTEVLGVLETMLAEQQKQTMEAAQRVAEKAGVAAGTPAPDEDSATTEGSKEAEVKPTVGLIRNGAEMKFTDKVIEMVDFVAKRLGLTVEFVDDLKNEAGQKINGDIKGKHVRLSTSGSRGIKFITGHEFFHRMKDLVEEKTYNDFVESIKAFIGEKEWKAAMAHQRAVYRAHNARVAKDAMTEMSIEEVAKIAALLNVGIEGLSLDDAKAVVANAASKLADKGDATAYNIFPQMLKYSDALMTEECAADIAGELVTNTRVFSDFVENNKSNYALVRGFRKAIRAMREFFGSFGYTDQQRKLKALDKMLEATLKEAVANEALTWEYLGERETEGTPDTALELARYIDKSYGYEREKSIAEAKSYIRVYEAALKHEEALGATLKGKDKKASDAAIEKYKSKLELYKGALEYLNKKAKKGTKNTRFPETSQRTHKAVTQQDYRELESMQQLAWERYGAYPHNIGNYDGINLLSEESWSAGKKSFRMYVDMMDSGFKSSLRQTIEYYKNLAEKVPELKAHYLDLAEIAANRLAELRKEDEAKGEKKSEAEDGQSRKSLIGEVGASALDMAEEATIRMDNLAVAREMETSGKDAKAIRKATGWERGADGLWRYEIMDAEVNLYDGDENAIRKKIEVAEEEEKDFMQQSKADTKELRERTNTYLAEMRDKYGVAEGEETDAMTEKEIAHLQSLTGKEIAFEDYKERRRNELYNRRMALEAQLAYVSVKNSEAPAEIAATRLGHILQGNDAEMLFTAYPSLRDIEVQFVTDIRDGAFAAYATKGGYKRIELNAKKTPVDMIAPYILHEVQHAIQDIEGFAGGGNLSSLQSDENVTTEEAYDYYRKIAGEVEARNVSARINMTPEERRAKLLSETEDVAREDQIFMREGVEMAMAQPRFSLSEETTQIFDAAKAKFGTTNDMREAGYILPDGSMLDFSGRHQVEGDASFLNGDRTVDHREISDIAYDANDNETGINTDLGDFLDRGAIRIDSNAGAININVAPTKAQKDRLKRLIERNDGYVYIDFGKGWDTEHYAEYEAARASRVLGDIDRYFDEGIKPTGNVRFSLQETNDRFNAELATLTEENKDKVNLSLGMPSDILLAAGVVNKPMKLYGAKLWAKSQKHGYKVSDLRDLPKNVAAPIAIFKGSTDGSHAVLTEIKVGENNVLATLSVGKGGEDIDFNIISSVYGKQSDNVVKWIDDGKLEYVDKEKALNYLHHSAPIAEALSNPRLISTANIIQNFENPKVSTRNSLITPEMDAAYMDAVERGDMETAQQMVMEAAKMAGYTVHAYHGTPNTVYNPDWKNAVEEIAKILFPNEEKIDLDAEYGTEEYKRAWRIANEIRYFYRDYRPRIPVSLQKRFERGINTRFTVFDESRRGSSTGAKDAVKGFFFSPNPLFASQFRETFEQDAFTGVMKKTSVGDGVLYDVFIKPQNLLDLRNLSAIKSKARQMGDTEGYDVVINKVKNGRNKGKVEEEIMVTDPSLIKSADPVTYDDNGNVIPLSERFNPEKEDIRYSLPTDLLTDFADEFKALQDEYTSLDSATIDHKHPFRAHKREVVQKYADHVADVLGLSCETFVIDAGDGAQVAEAYDKYKKSHQLVSQQYPHRATPLADLNDFKAGLKGDKGKYLTGLYLNGTDFILMIISENDDYNEQNGYLQVNIHENVHGAMEALGITDFEKEMVLSEAEKYQTNALKRYLDGYDNETDAAKGEEIVAYAINSRLNPKYGKLLLEFFEGGATLSDIWKSYNLQLPLRLSLTRKILNYLKDGYEAKNKIANNAGGSNKAAAGSSPNATNSKRLSSKYLGEDIRVAERWDRSVDTRFMLPDPDPSEVFYDEMPLYDEQGNEIDFNSLTPEESKKVLDDKVRQMLEAEYDHNVSTIRNEAREARAAVNEAYREAKSKRRKGERAARTNAARIDEIFGDTPFESLPYEVQALILIATGEAKIYWGDKGNKRGLASELGLKGSTGDRHAYRNIWGGAKKSFDEVVHSWWESIGGYESGVDANDLRNALISALQSVQSSKDAMQEIINKYDDLANERDNALAEVDRMEEKELHEAKSAYEQHLANFELAEGEERAAYHDRAAQFFGNQSLSRVEDILEDLAGEIERNKRKIERLKAENKDVYGTLAEGIQKSKEVVLRALERLRMFAGMEEVDLNDVARLINLVKTARSQRQMNNLSAQATALVQRVSIKKAKTNLMRLLSLKLSNTDIIHKMLKESGTWTKEEREAILKHLWKVSRNGLRVSKAVHKDTKEIVDALAEQVKAFKKETKNIKGADLAAKIQSKLAELEKELHPEVVYDGEGNVQDNANLPTDFNAENKHLSKFIFKSYLEMAAKEAAYHEASATLREKINNGENTAEANADVVVTRENYLHALTEFNSTLENLIVEGKDELRDWNAQKEKHEIEIRSMGIRAIGGEKASGQGKRSKWGARQRARWNTTANAPYWTFETVLEKIDHKAPYKKGKMYTYFMDKWADANDDLITRYAAHFDEMAEAMRKCFPNDAENILKMKRNPYKLFQYIMRKAESKPIGTLTYKEMGEDGQLRDAQIVLNIANAMYIIAMWRQPRYQKAMEEKHKITQSDIDALMTNIASVDAGFLDFMDWVNEKFLPSTRLEYDVVYRKMNGGSMPKEINYFPARVAGHKEVDLANIDNGALPTTPSALKDRVSAHIMPQLGMDYFKVLESHIQDMDNWAAFAELTSDLNVLLSSDEFRRRCNEYMGGLGGDGGGKGSIYDLFKQTSLIATGMYRGDAGIQQLFGQLQKAWATSNIAFRFWTAVKQISSVTTGLTEGWRIALHMSKAASLVGIYSEIKSAMEISPSLRYRWKSGAAGMEALMRETQREDGYTVQRGAYEKTKDALSGFVNGLVRVGMTPNAAVDLLACSIIVNTVYETEIARLTGGKREATAEEKRAAVRKAERAFNTTQQSSEGAYLAPVQASPAYGGLTTYMNASFALHRKRMGGVYEIGKLGEKYVVELWKGIFESGYKMFLKENFNFKEDAISAKDAFADIMRGIVGDLAFSAMGWGLMELMAAVYEWLGGDGDDDDTEAEMQAFFETYWLPVFNGFLGGSQITSLFQGYDTSMIPAYDELLEDIRGIFDDKGDWRVEVAQAATKYGLGIDIKSLYRIGAGLENMVAEEEGENAGSILMFLNAPNKYIKAFVGDRREGETLQQYHTRIMRLYTLFDDVMYEELCDENGKYIGEGAPSMIMSQTQAKALNKEYEAAFLKDVVVRNGGWDEYRAMMSTEMLYKDICTFIGVTPDAKPSKVKLRNTVYSTGEYVAPVYGLSQKEHGELLSAESYVAKAHYNRTRWVGGDENYYDLLKEEYRKKSELIDKYNEYIK